jgi:subtilisin family serine protease
MIFKRLILFSLNIFLLNAQTAWEANDLYYQSHRQWGIYRTNTMYAWDLNKGSTNVIIAILSGGIYLDQSTQAHHEDIDVTRIILHNDYTGSPYPFKDETYESHGVSVAGILGSNADNSIGITPINWNSDILIERIYIAENSAPSGTVFKQSVIDASNYSNTRVINLSAGFIQEDVIGNQQLEDDIIDAIDYTVTKDILFVTSAGNENKSSVPPNFRGKVTYPGVLEPLYDNLIVVSALNKQDDIRSTSSYGPEVTLIAPGREIRTLKNNGSYHRPDGTSFAAPIVSGIASLVFSENPSLTAPEVKDILIKTANDLGQEGRDDEFGHGLVNGEQAVKVAEYLNNHPNATYYESSRVNIGSTIKVFDANAYADAEKITGKTYKVKIYEGTHTFSRPTSVSSLTDSYVFFDTNGGDFRTDGYVTKNNFEITSLTANSVTVKVKAVKLYSNGNEKFKTSGENNLFVKMKIYSEAQPISGSFTQGPFSLDKGENGLYQVSSSGGTGTYTFQWYEREIPGSYQAVGSNQNSYIMNMGIADVKEVKVVISSGSHSPLTLEREVIAIGGEPLFKELGSKFPTEFGISQNFPNPFNPVTTINYTVPKSSKVLVKVYNSLGKLVQTLVNENKSPGVYQVKFDGKGMSSGIYFYTIEAGNFKQTKKMTLIK